MSGYVPQNRGNKSRNRNGAAASRRLRTAGWNISPNGRKYKSEGIFVSAGGDLITVLFDLGIDAKNVRLANEMVEELTAAPWANDVRISLPKNAGAVFIHFDYVKL